MDKSLKSKLDVLRGDRNEALHGVLSTTSYGQLEKLFYAAAKLAVKIEEASGWRIISNSRLVGKLITDFERAEYNTFFLKVAEAKRKAAIGIQRLFSAVAFGRNEMPMRCPVCKLEGLAQGVFSPETTTINFGYEEEHMFFRPRSFQCDHCGIIADGEDELQFIGTEKVLFVSIDRDVPAPPHNLRAK